MALDIVEKSRSHRVGDHIKNLVPAIEQPNIDLHEAMLIAQGGVADLVCSAHFFIHMADDWSVVLKHYCLGDSSVEFFPVDFVKVNGLVNG